MVLVSEVTFVFHSVFFVFHLKFSVLGRCLNIFVGETPQKNTYGKINTRKRNLH